MEYYIIRSVGDKSFVESILNYSFKDTVFEKNGSFFAIETYTDIYDDTREGVIPVYATKQEAWRVLIKDIDNRISELQKIREDTFHRALDDGGFVDKKKALNWVNDLKATASGLAGIADGDGYP